MSGHEQPVAVYVGVYLRAFQAQAPPELRSAVWACECGICECDLVVTRSALEATIQHATAQGLRVAIVCPGCSKDAPRSADCKELMPLTPEIIRAFNRAEAERN